MYFDRFDIVEAHYAYCSDWHNGQWSSEYVRLCRIGRYFRPGSHWNGYESLSENGQEIYDALARAERRLRGGGSAGAGAGEEVVRAGATQAPQGGMPS